MAGYLTEVNADAPSAHWRLGESALPLVSTDTQHSFTQDTAGFTLDQAGALQDGQDTGAIRHNGAGLLNAPDHNDLDLGDVFSLEFWWKRDPAQENNSYTLLSKGSSAGYRVRHSGSTDRLILGFGSTDVLAVPVPDSTDFHHYVFTKNGATRKSYRDAADFTDTAGFSNPTFTDNSSTLRLGGTTSPGDAYGTLAELAVYKGTVLALARIAAHYAAAFPAPNPPPLVAAPPYSDSAFPDEDFTAGDPLCLLNVPIPADPIIHPDSDAMVAALLATGGVNPGPGHLVVNGDTGGDVDIPLYFASPSDPLYDMIADNAPYGIWPYAGQQIRIPDGAKPAQGVDRHMSVVQPDGTCWDFYKVAAPPTFVAPGGPFSGGGEIHFRWGGPKEDFYGFIDAQGGNAVGANTVAWPGQIRACQLAAGRIPHVVVCTIRCCGRDFVYPAGKNAFMCSNMVPPESEVGTVGCGHRIQLDYTEAEIDALSEPAWKKTIWKQMVEFGVMPLDTNGQAWQLRKESSTMYTALGYDDPLKTFAKARYLAGDAGINVDGAGLYVMRIREGIDWNRLRIVEVGRSERIRLDGEWREKPVLARVGGQWKHKPVAGVT